MSRARQTTIVLLGLAVLLLLAIPLLASAAAPTVTPNAPALGETAAVGRATIEVNGRALAFTQRNGYSVRRAALFDRNGTRVGRSHLVCIEVTKFERGCHGTYTFPRGVIVVAGIVQEDGYVLAVVGGTGFYDNARGAMKVIPSGCCTAHRVFFQLVG